MKKTGALQKQGTDRNTWRLSLALNIVILGVMLMLFYPKYANKADAAMQNLLYGTIPGLKTSQLVFSNVILGKFLSILLALFPNGAWYTIIQICFILAALTAVGYVVLKRLPGVGGIILLVFVLCFLGYETYLTIGYLRTACILSLSGVMLYTYAFQQDKKRICTETVLSAILLLIGSLYSFRVFCLVLIAGMLPQAVRTLAAKAGKPLLRLAVDAAVIVLACTALWGIDCLSYRGSYTLQYRNDFETIYFKDARQTDLRYEEVPGAESAAQCWAISQGVFLNGNEDALIAVRSIARQTKELSSDTVAGFFRSVPVNLFSIDSFYLWLALSVFFLAFSKERLKVLLPSLALVLLGSFLIYFTNAQNSGTAYFILFATASMYLLTHAGGLRTVEWRSAAAFAAVLFIVLYSRFSGTLLRSVRQDQLTSGFKTVRSTNEYLVDLDRYCLNFGAFTKYPADLVPENVTVANGFYSTMTDYDPPVLKINDDTVFKWVYNTAGFSADNLVDFDR